MFKKIIWSYKCSHKTTIGQKLLSLLFSGEVLRSLSYRSPQTLQESYLMLPCEFQTAVPDSEFIPRSAGIILYQLILSWAELTD